MRVQIRAPTPLDQREVTELARASAAWLEGWVSPPTEAQGFAAYLRRCEGDDYEGMLVCLRESGTIVGAVNLSQIFFGNFQNAYVGYWIGAPYAGQGLMTEAVGLVLHHAFQTLDLHRVEANIQPENAASIALVKRLGFTLEGFSRRYLRVGGEWRDHERWAILAEDWLPGVMGDARPTAVGE